MGLDQCLSLEPVTLSETSSMRIVTFLLLIFTIHPLLAQDAHVYCSKYKGTVENKRLTVDDRRSDSIDILHTHIDLDISELGSKEISAQTTLTVQARLAGVDKFSVDLEGLILDSIRATGLSSYDQGSTQIELKFDEALSTNEPREILFYYRGAPKKDASGWGGFYFTGEYAWNLGVGFAADPHSYGRIWFPCFDNFIERSTFSFDVHVDSTKYASCNGLMTNTTHNSNGTVTYSWEIAESIPSYLANVSVGSYEVLESVHQGIENDFPVQLFARASDTAKLKRSFIHLHDAISAFEAAYGDHKFEKVGYSLVPFNSGAMEHATNISYPIYAANGGLGNESLMAHELGHMWWGNNATCETDGDMWMNEGWASFSELIFDEYVYGREEYIQHLLEDLRFMLQFGHHFEEGYRPVSGQPHEYVYGDHVYKKGAIVAHNLRGYLGDSIFFDGAAAFMDAFEFQPVSSDSLERFLSHHTGIDLSYFFRDWVFNPGWNALVLDSFRTVENGSGGYDVELFIQQKLKGTAQFHGDVPVYYSIYDKDWSKISGKSSISGKYDVLSVESDTEPVWIVLNEGYEIANAVTADQWVVNEIGNCELENAFWEVHVASVTDSALVRIEQIWSYPDPVKDWSNQAFQLNNNRYWRVSGLDLDNVVISGQFFYDGRSSGNSGYLDITLLTENEDSLILLYRSSPAADWEEYGYYEKDVLGVSVNAHGLMELDKILPGEYTLANRDPGVLEVDKMTSSGATLYPNPSDGIIHLSDTDGKVEEVRFYDSLGKLIAKEKLVGPSLKTDLSQQSDSVITYELVGKRSEVIKVGKLILR